MLCVAAHAKINWTLDILGVRSDGYHLMDMLMQTVSLCDLLWLEEAPALSLEAVQHGAGAEAACAEGDALTSEAVRFDDSNLVYRAALRLREHCGVEKGARMRLLKRIPSGAGMGGGSADAAAALKGLNLLWGLGLSQETLLEIGLSLGADVPFMLTGGLAHVEGIGERITPLLPAPQVWLVLLKPCGGLSTREIFAAYDASDPLSLARPDHAAAQAALLRGDLCALGAAMNNVLQGVSAAARPALKAALTALEQAGAVRAMMTGSGSVVYGLFHSCASAAAARAALRPLALREGWGEVWLARTLARG